MYAFLLIIKYLFFNNDYVRKLCDAIFFAKAKHIGSVNENQNSTNFKGFSSIICISLEIPVILIQNICIEVGLAYGYIGK